MSVKFSKANLNTQKVIILNILEINNMKLTERDIDKIEDFGELNGKPVRLIRCKGGFQIAMGIRPGDKEDSCLTAGSHPAICRFNLIKQFKNSYAPSMMKSTSYNDSAIVENHSHFLSNELRKSGHEIHSVQSDNQISFHITRHGIKIADVDSYIQDKALVYPNLNAPKEFSRGLAGAATEKAKSCGITKLKIEG